MAASEKKQAKKSDSKKPVITEWMYGVIKSPVVTEKSTRGSEHNQISFKVDLNATKPDIKKAVEALFDVKVKAVNTLVRKGKTKMFRGRPGFRSDTKKAIISLEPGQMIDTGTGV